MGLGSKAITPPPATADTIGKQPRIVPDVGTDIPDAVAMREGRQESALVSRLITGTIQPSGNTAIQSK